MISPAAFLRVLRPLPVSLRRALRCALPLGVLWGGILPGPRAVAYAAEQVVTLGDSLTFAYEAEFGFDVTIQGLGQFGDGFGPEVRNWIEILGDPTHRSEAFDQGARDSILLTTSFFPPASTSLFLRREFNWAVPGLQIDQLRRFLSGEVTLLDLLGESPEFSILRTALSASDFSDDDFDVDDLDAQIRSQAERVVLFIGGNDINSVYGTVYDGGSAGSFVDDFIADAAFVVDWVLARNPAIEVVLVSVPHVGITPDVKARHPTDPVRTARVTALLEDLNGRLRDIADYRGLGFADLFSRTLQLLTDAPLCLHGLTFANSGSETGDLDFVWLNGELSYNFHPNTNAHALLANEVVHAFNRTYGTTIPPLTASEMLGGLLQRSPAAIDLPFADWMAGHGLAGRPATDDSDGDRLPAALEFAVGLDPTSPDSEHVTTTPLDGGDGSFVRLTYPRRLPTSTHYLLRPAATGALSPGAPFVPFPPSSTALPDGREEALLPIVGPNGFLRLEAILLP